MCHDAIPSAAGWRWLDAASDLVSPLDAQQALRTTPRWERSASPPRRKEVARPWNPFGGVSDWPLALELVHEWRSAVDVTWRLRVTYPYGHDPLLAQWLLVFEGYAGRKEEPCKLPGNPVLPAVLDQPAPAFVLLEVINSQWLPTLGMPGQPPETLRHFVLQMEVGRVWQLAAQRCVARRTEEQEGSAGAGIAAPVDGSAAYQRR